MRPGHFPGQRLEHDSELGASGQARAIAMIDLQTARLHMMFGLFLLLGLVLAVLTNAR
jgi:hypothetical protein